ncbi:hypothetical protein GCM10027402_22350 [Arthrobacter monumenti]
MLGDLRGERRGSESDPGPQLKNVHRPEDFLEDSGNTLCGVHPCAGDLEEGRFASAVGAEDDPTFTFFDLPINTVQKRLAAAYYADRSQFKNVTHRTRH